MKAVFCSVEDWERDFFRKALKGCTLVFEDGPLDEQRAAKHADADVLATFIYSTVTRAVIERMPKLKLVTTMSTGFDHIDLQACAARGITVCNVPAYGDNTVAEHTFALILALAKNLVPSVERTRRGNFSLDGLRGIDLEGKTLGVIGTGKIGRHAIRIAKGFGMTVVAYDPRPDPAFAVELGFTYLDTLEAVMARADVLSLHAPLNAKTKHMINTKNIGKLKRGAMLINTARGGLVQTEALLKALKSGIVSAAGLDVLEEECFVKEEKALLTEEFQKECDLRTVLQEHMLLGMDTVIITPHNAFNSREALQRILDTTVENIQAFRKGKPVNAVKA